MEEGHTENLISSEEIAGTAIQAGRIDNVHVNSPVPGPAGPREVAIVHKPVRVPVFEVLLDWMAGGAKRRVVRVAERLMARFSTSPMDDEALRKAAREYRRSLRLTLRVDTRQAHVFFRAYDMRIPAERYPLTENDEPWLAGLTFRPDLHLLTVVFEIASRVPLPALQVGTQGRLADLLTAEGDAATVMAHLCRWQSLQLLRQSTVSTVMTGYLRRASLEQDRRRWRESFHHLPQAAQPDLFEVHCLLDHGRAAVRLADRPMRVTQALACCLRSRQVDDVASGLRLAREQGVVNSVIALAGHLADLLFDTARYADAMPYYREAGRQDGVSRCHEELRQYFEALFTCPVDQTGRLVRLVDRCLPDIHLLGERQQFDEAARQVQRVIVQLERATEATPDVIERQDHVTALRADLLASTRRHFSGLVQRELEGGDQAAVYRDWSGFEEAAGELAQAAYRAEDAGEILRASRLFRQAGHPSEAARVLRGIDTPEGLVARAEAYEAGGDLAGAARLYERCDQQERAMPLFLRAGEFKGAAHCLVRWLGPDAVEDDRLDDCLRRTGNYDELVRHCLTAMTARQGNTRGVAVLRRLVGEGLVPSHLTDSVSQALDALGAEKRRQFQERAQAWVGRARNEIDQRFSRIWGFDLGTTTCAAAIYDTETGQPAFCPWRGQTQFASTLSLDQEGNELVGLSGEEIFAPWLVGHIDAAKRRMGERMSFKIRDRSYRPEEVAARMIHQAREIVEIFLAGKVRERVSELAYVELGQVHEEWLTWLEQNHDLRLNRPRVVVTIPAFFSNNQKDATRSAAEIAGVDLVRLLHEPTAACISAARERLYTDSEVAVVDLGAGTLDISALEIGDNVYDVRYVGGDTRFGGRDLDAAITDALATRLKRQDGAVPLVGRARRRLEIAAESLKVTLSAQKSASYTLRAFDSTGDVSLELNRAELAEVLAEPLARLRRICTEFRKSSGFRPSRLFLVGRPMLSPLLRDAVQQAFGVDRTEPTDARTAVASGAALLGAMHAGLLKDELLLDVTPLALGIRVMDREDRVQFDELIAANTTIPAHRSDIYSTHEDNQTTVGIEIFNGALDTRSHIGRFQLTGIPPAPRGVPQIEVSFDIDGSCVLSVTARDLGSGKSNSISIADTTLLPPEEIAESTRRYEEQREREQQRRHLKDMRERLLKLAELVMTDDSAAVWHEFRQRQSTHRPAAGATDDETRRLLVEMFNEANQTEVDLELTRRSATKSAEFVLASLTRPVWDSTDDADELTRLHTELQSHVDQLRRLTTRVTQWNAVLLRLAMTEPDPLLRFRYQYEAGDYPQALDALAQLPEPPTDPVDMERHARCLAEVGDAEAYHALRRTHADVTYNPLTALVRVQATFADGSSASGTGFLIQERLVVTSRSHVDDPATGRPTMGEAVMVDTGSTTETTPVARVHVASSPGNDLAVLQLARPVAGVPLALGFATLVHLGDQVRVAMPPDETGAGWRPRTGVIDRFERSSRHDFQLYRVRLQLPPSSVGGPVLNDLGEAVGVIMSTNAGEHADILGVDALDEIRATIAFDRDEGSARLRGQ